MSRSEADLVDAYLANKALERLETYVRRGRRFRELVQSFLRVF